MRIDYTLYKYFQKYLRAFRVQKSGNFTMFKFCKRKMCQRKRTKKGISLKGKLECKSCYQPLLISGRIFILICDIEKVATGYTM